MEITSLAFAGFVGVVFVVYHLLPLRTKQAWLLAASFVFYALWDWRFGAILLLLTLLNFWWGQQVAQRGTRGWMWAGIGLNIAALLVFKYHHFYLEGLSRLLGNADLGALVLLVPVGLSFYLVQVISYFVDVRMKRIQPETDWLLFSLYLFYFPKLLSGPMERARTFIPKLKQPRVVDADLLTRSLWLVLLGLFRKLVIADSLMALFPQDAFTQPGMYAGQHLAAWLLGYAFALYNDFAGYTSIMRGISGLLGIELSRNFRRPYFSRNFTEFWKRWHISLSEWLRDYIFFPTTRTLLKRISNRQHVINLVLPPMATMLVSGMWHGLSWHMILWGGLHGIYQVVERVISLRRPSRPVAELRPWRQYAAMGLVFVLTVLAWVPFRMELPVAAEFLSGMFSPANWPMPAFRQAASDLLHGSGFWSWPEYQIPDPRIFLVILPALWLDWRQEKREDELFFLQWGPWMRAVLLAALLTALLLVSGSDQQVPFVYQGF